MKVRSVTALAAAFFAGACALPGCQSGETLEQDTEIRTRSDGTRVKTEEKVVRQDDGTIVKTETKKVDRPDVEVDIDD